MNITHKQHYVQQQYLSSWENEHQLWVYDKFHNKSEQKGKKAICYEIDYYKVQRLTDDEKRIFYALYKNVHPQLKNIINELSGEKIDVIEWNEDPSTYIAEALLPAKVMAVDIKDEERFAQVIVPDDQLSLAIGKAGQNARLAAKLTNWKIDIKSESQFREMLSKMENAEVEENVTSEEE